MSPADVSGLYEDLQAEVPGLSEAINTDAMLNAQEPQVQAATDRVHGRGESECNPRRRGRDACRGIYRLHRSRQASGRVPSLRHASASGPGHLSCTDTGPQWKAADAGRTVEPSTVIAVGNVLSKAVAPDELAQINSQSLRRQADAIRANFIASCDNLSELNGFCLNGCPQPTRYRQPGQKGRSPLPADQTAGARAPRRRRPSPRRMSATPRRFARLPLGQLVPEDASLAVQRVLDARSVSRLYRTLDVLRTATDASLNESPPGPGYGSSSTHQPCRSAPGISTCGR